MQKETVSLAAAAGATYMLRSEYKGEYFSVEVTEIISPKLERDRNLIFPSDLHSNEFGRDNGELVAAIRRLNPDAVLSGGDMMICKGKRSTKVPLKLFRQLAASYPVYCGNRSHENHMVWGHSLYGDFYEEYRSAMTAMGAGYLEGSCAFLGRDLRIAGLDLASCFYRKALCQKASLMPPDYLERKLDKGPSDCREEPFTILLAHSPLYFDSYTHWGADLTLAKRLHEGTIRILGLGGVMTPQYQFFSPWYAGDSERDGKRMIVSRGLGAHSINIRLDNRLQLVLTRSRGMWQVQKTIK